MDGFARVAGALLAEGVRFVVIGVWGANYYTRGSLFVTQDQDLFVPPDPENLLRAWRCCEAGARRRDEARWSFAGESVRWPGLFW